MINYPQPNAQGEECRRYRKWMLNEIKKKRYKLCLSGTFNLAKTLKKPL
jgi:hypothetical protein